VRFFFAKWFSTLAELYPASFAGGSGGNAHEQLKRLGFYPIFASIAETAVFSNPMVNRTIFDQTLSQPVEELFLFAEYKVAEQKNNIVHKK
jgi:hypothetical protein